MKRLRDRTVCAFFGAWDGWCLKALPALESGDVSLGILEVSGKVAEARSAVDEACRKVSYLTAKRLGCGFGNPCVSDPPCPVGCVIGVGLDEAVGGHGVTI